MKAKIFYERKQLQASKLFINEIISTKNIKQYPDPSPEQMKRIRTMIDEQTQKLIEQHLFSTLHRPKPTPKTLSVNGVDAVATPWGV